MKMEIKYQVFDTENLFIQKFSGIFSIEHYIKYSRLVLSKLPKESINRVLIDFRDLKFERMPDSLDEELGRIIEVRKNINKKELNSIDVKLVIWVDKPLPTAIVHMFISNFPTMDYDYCSTDLNALKLLKVSENFTNLESTVCNLENIF